MNKRLSLFSLVDETISLLDIQNTTYQYVEGLVKGTFMEILDDDDNFIELNSRIKSDTSLKEKIIRHKYYLEFKSGQDILDHLHDLIGITVKCRFLTDEELIYRLILTYFPASSNEFSKCSINDNIYLNVSEIQPKSEMNGYQSYRLDGYCLYNERRINFELQIKSLTHSFWSDIEHQIIYKNNQFILADDFMKRIMNSIRDNLNVVDSQLKYVSDEVMRQDTLQTNIGLSESNFKIFLAKSINDLYCQKMHDVISIDTDFRKSSEIISQYIYIHNFLRSNYPQQQMLLYYDHLNYLKDTEIGIMDEVLINEVIKENDYFVCTLGNYCLNKINIDFDWHSFFVMLFSVQNDFSLDQLIHFLKVIKELYFQPHFYESLNHEKDSKVRDELVHSFYELVTEVLVSVDDISIFFEEKINASSQLIIEFIKRINDINESKDSTVLLQELQLRIKKIFQ